MLNFLKITDLKKEKFKNKSQNMSVALDRLQEAITLTSQGAALSISSLGGVSKSIKSTIELIDDLQEELERFRLEAQVVSANAVSGENAANEVRKKTEVGSQLSSESDQAAKDLQLQMNSTYDKIVVLLEAVKGAVKAVQKIESITFETKLLSFNASVEAARAGEHGKGFSVVASEIQRLAQTTATETSEILSIMGKVSSQLSPALEAMVKSRDLSQTGAMTSQRMAQFFDEISSLSDVSAGKVKEIEASVQKQRGDIEKLIRQLEDSKQSRERAIQETQNMSERMTRLMDIISQAYQSLGTFESDTVFHRCLGHARDLSKSIEDLFENKIKNNELLLDDCLDLTYLEINGGMYGHLNRFFDTSRVPRAGFSPPKFSTPYDVKIDQELLGLLESTMEKEQSLVFALLFDLNGYAPIHIKSFMKNWTGDTAKDLADNRCKRFFDDSSVILKASRFGLRGAEEGLPHRISREDFRRHGAELGLVEGSRETYLVQTYARDTGEVMTLLSIPFYIRNQRYGSIGLAWLLA